MFGALKGALCLAASAIVTHKGCQNKTVTPQTLIDPNELSPIVLVPGLGGSRLLADIDKTHGVKSHCSLRKLKDAIWPPIKGAIPGMIKCWADNVKLLFDQVTGKIADSSGVHISVPGFGTTDKVEYLADLKLPPAEYLHKLVSEAVNWGYVRDKNIRAAPYDFRKSPELSGDYFDRLQELIESMFRENGNIPVTIIAHSLGAMHTLHFLRREVNDTWKAKHIKQYVVLGGPLGGAVQTVRAVVSGYNFGVITVSNLDIREVQRTWPTIYYLLPKPGIGVWEGTPVLQREVLLLPRPITYNASDADYIKLFRDMKDEVADDMYLKFKNRLDPRISPGVPTHCVVGVGTKTPRTLDYRGQSFPDKSATDVSADGDGTVITESANLCRQWATNKSPVVYKEFDKAGHIEMVKDKRIIAYLKQILAVAPSSN